MWIGLNLFRVRNPHVQMTSWIMVLVASLSMPLLMHWTTVTVTVHALPMPAPDNLWPAEHGVAGACARRCLELGMPAAVRSASHAASIGWASRQPSMPVVAGMLLLRLAIGIYLTWRLARAATPIERILDRRLARARERRDRRSGDVRIDHPASAAIRRLGFARSARPCSRMRAPTSPTAISTSCCWPRSIARCSGSARLRGGSSIRLAELAEIISDASAIEVARGQAVLCRDPARSRAARFGRRRRGWRWRGPARCARASSAFSPPTSAAREARLAEANLGGGGHPAAGRRLRRQHRLPHAAGIGAGR